MKFLKKLFGGSDTAIAPQASTPPTKNPAEDPNMIRVFDGYGREVFITRQDWRDKVLLGNIEERWNDAHKLYDLIYQSLHDGFFEDMVRPAERLVELEPDRENSAVLLAVVYLKLQRLDDSERVLKSYVQTRGETGTVLTNLAKVYAERGDEAQSLELLWRGLQLDPNQDNGMGWYEVIHREKGGETAGLAALRRIAGIPGSWRAQLWLARNELQSGHIQAALDLYRICIDAAGQPVPVDLLMQMSGDLGKAGHLPEILAMVKPHFNAAVHGLQVGNNLIKAHLDLSQLDDAHKVLEQLYAQKRPDWAQALGFWDTEIAKARVAANNAQAIEPPQVEMAACYGPVWLDYDSPAGELFGARPVEQTMISLLGSTAEVAGRPDHIQHQLADPPGRLSRALPLFLSEQLALRAGVFTQTLVPWINRPVSGFVLGGSPWSDEDAARYCEGSERMSKYVVITHLRAQSDLWTLQLRLVRVADRKCLATGSESCSMEQPGAAVLALARQLLDAISREEKLGLRPSPPGYALPPKEHFPVYLLRLEQLLAVRLARMDEVPSQFLNGEREIAAGNLQQCLDYPTSVNARLLLARTLLSMKKACPQVVPEYKARVELLQKDKPLAQPAHKVIQEMLNEAFAG